MLTNSWGRDKKPMANYLMINLEEYFCNKGFSSENHNNNGNFTGMGSSFPVEFMPPSKEITINNVPFMFPQKNSVVDNMEFNNQVISFEKYKYDYIYFLGAADNGSFEEDVMLSDGVSFETITIGLSDWLATEPLFGEELAIKCDYMHTKSGHKMDELNPKIWFARVNLQSLNNSVFDKIIFSDNPGMHLFSITLKRGG